MENSTSKNTRERRIPYKVINHPIIQEAIKANNLTNDDLINSEAWKDSIDPFMTSITRQDVPFLFLEEHIGSVDWGKNVSLDYEKLGHRYRFKITLEDRIIPDSISRQFTGRRLSDFVDLPGADKVTIVRWEEKKHANGADIELTIE